MKTVGDVNVTEPNNSELESDSFLTQAESTEPTEAEVVKQLIHLSWVIRIVVDESPRTPRYPTRNRKSPETGLSMELNFFPSLCLLFCFLINFVYEGGLCHIM